MATTTAIVPTSTPTDVAPSFSSSLNWSPKYTRTRHRNVRCFPCCLPQHKSRSFCGRSAPVHFTVPEADAAGKPISEGRVQCMEVYCCFRSKRLPIWLNVGQVCSEQAKDQHQEDLVVASFLSFDPDTRRAIFEARPPRKWQYTFQRHAPTSLYSDALDNDWHAFSAFVVDTETQLCWGQCDSPSFRIISSWKIVMPKSASSSSSSTKASRKSSKRSYSNPDGGRGFKKERIGAGAMTYANGFVPQQMQMYPNHMMMSPNMYPLQQQQQQQGYFAPQGGYMVPGMYGMPQMNGYGAVGGGGSPNMYSQAANTPNMYPLSSSTPNVYPAPANAPNMYPSSMPMWMPANNPSAGGGAVQFAPMPNATVAPQVQSPTALPTPPTTTTGMLTIPMPNNNNNVPTSLAASFGLFNNNSTYTMTTPVPADTNYACMAGMTQVNPNKPVMPMLMPLGQQQPAPQQHQLAPQQVQQQLQQQLTAQQPNALAAQQQQQPALQQQQPAPQQLTAQQPNALAAQQQQQPVPQQPNVLAPPQHQQPNVLAPQQPNVLATRQEQAHVAAATGTQVLLVKVPEPTGAAVVDNSGSGSENVDVASKAVLPAPKVSAGPHALSIMANAAALQVELGR